MVGLDETGVGDPMTDIMATDMVETVMGGLILVVFLVMVWRLGPLRILGELLAHAAMNLLFLAAIVGLGMFFVTDIGQVLGGLDTWFGLVLGVPVLVLLIGLFLGGRSWWSRGSDDGEGGDND